MFRTMRLACAWLATLSVWAGVAPWESVAAIGGEEARRTPAEPSVAARPNETDASVRSLLEQNLRASGVETPEDLARYERAFEEKLGDIIARVGRTHSEYRRARKLHEALHQEILLRYKATADGLDAVLDRGEYNCVSASLLYGIAARAVGLNPQVVESPRHIFIRLDIDGHDLDIESTSARGFDLSRDLELFRRFVIAYKYATPEELQKYGAMAIFEEFHGLGKPVSLERAAAFLWHNTGERALDKGEGPRAAACFLQEFRLNPDLAFRSERLGVYLARAFRMEYEEGRFDTAYQIAETELQIFPGRTTARDRFLAAASKRIQEACDAGSSEKAEGVLGLARVTLEVPADLVRLERETCPRIAAAAVRAGEWDRARRMAESFAAAEPDEIEATRFLTWVENRHLGGASLALEDVCTDPRRTIFGPGSGIYGSSSGHH